MANRRQFLQTAATFSAASAVSASPFAGVDGAASIDALICDKRYQYARHFGTAAMSLGVPLRTFEGDITALWLNELQPLWKAGPAIIGGLSERHALFLLERLAWDHGLRVVFEAEHESLEPDRFRHRIIRSADTALAGNLSSASAQWPVVLAEAMAKPGAAVRDFRPTDAAMFDHLGETDKLYSWIIAPRQAV